MSEQNALILLATNPTKILGDGIKEDLPIFNLALMKDLAKQELAKLETLPKVDLTTEKGRKTVRAAVKPVKETFSDFEKNIKVVKKASSDIPKKCDAVSLEMRKMSEAAIEKALSEVDEIDAAKAEVTKWFNTLQGKDKDIAPIPQTKYELENGLQALVDKQPHKYFNEAEIADFWKQKNEYVAEWEKCLNRIYLEEKAAREADERRREEDKRLRDERERLEAEQRRIAQEAAALEEQKRQVAVNPIEAASNPNRAEECGLGAPPAPSPEAKKAMRREALQSMEALLDGIGVDTGIALAVCEAIHKGKIPHVRFVYD